MLCQEIALQTVFCTKTSAQIFLCYVTDVRYYDCFRWIASRHYWSLITPGFKNVSFNTL